MINGANRSSSFPDADMKALEQFPAIYPDVHAQRIGAYFADKVPARDAMEKLDAELASLKKFYVLCFTNRCGSNFLAQALASDGRLKQAGENLNFDAVLHQSERLGLGSFAQYMTWLVRHQRGPENVFGCKASAGQVIHLYNSGVLAKVKDRLEFVHIARRQPVAQGISMLIASRTKKWVSTDTGVPADIRYDPAELVPIIEALNRQNAAFTVLFDLFGLRAVPVQYERLVKDPVKVVRRVGRHLGLPNLKFVAEKVVYERQADLVNMRIRADIAEDFALGDGFATADDEENG
jgi:LPS sulfotransferase NodH